jgi:holo-[acyl-carrier protein] synthase
MIIIGHGIDILEFSRIKDALTRTPKIILKILHQNEIKEFEKIDNINNAISFVSKKFAAKEAFSKALSCGIFNEEFKMNKIEIKHMKSGAPYFNVEGYLVDIVRLFCHTAFFKLHLSISDTKTFCSASVIVESIDYKSLKWQI